jgi:hypothetical protein
MENTPGEVISLLGLMNSGPPNIKNYELATNGVSKKLWRGLFI